MIALDTSAIVAIALGEPEAEAFTEIIGARRAYVAAPTVLEIKLVLTPRLGAYADAFLEALLSRPSIRCVDFTLPMYRLAADAFDRFGKGRHAARLNFGDCMSYAVAKAHDVPLLFKGNDFAQTDIRPAFV
ncbi:type II toxin-antitoxin system VapC family toxin [Aquabacter sp. CN5-332]|uniref:type II toxin-antitoxin system VapC family toxin n=1 Tax=Aquabacter sp. CN5-332 TaxID=3156608 RepID=UPI0032B47845